MEVQDINYFIPVLAVSQGSLLPSLRPLTFDLLIFHCLSHKPQDITTQGDTYECNVAIIFLAF